MQTRAAASTLNPRVLGYPTSSELVNSDVSERRSDFGTAHSEAIHEASTCLICLCLTARSSSRGPESAASVPRCMACSRIVRVGLRAYVGAARVLDRYMDCRPPAPAGPNQTIYEFQNGGDGAYSAYPFGSVVLDDAGNVDGDYDSGTVWEITPWVGATAFTQWWQSRRCGGFSIRRDADIPLKMRCIYAGELTLLRNKIAQPVNLNFVVPNAPALAG